MRWWTTTLMAVSALGLTLFSPPVQAEPVTRPGGNGAVSAWSVDTVGRPARTVSAAAATARTVQTHYASPIRDARGYVDASRTLDAIVSRGSAVYSYLIYPQAGYDSAKDWAALPGFLAEARRRQVRVQVMLTPPASTSHATNPCSADRLLPYGGRYDVWMAEIGRLARVNWNLVSVAMDDYAYSSTNRPGAICRSFAPGTITRWTSILRATSGRSIPVMPVLYLHDLIGSRATYASIRHEAPHVVWPYVSIGETVMKAQYRAIRNAYSPSPKVHVMVYAAPFRSRTPTARTIAWETGMARRLGAPGVIIYQQPLR